jgi:ABC-type hemin transport system ATPase subunit
MSKPTNERRGRMYADRKRMNRVRMRYVARHRAWLEADKERVYEFAERIIALGLLARTTGETFARCSIIGAIARLDGVKLRERFGWLSRTGWGEFWGCYSTKARRERRKLAAG